MKSISLSLGVGIVLGGCTVAPTLEYNIIRTPADLRGDEIDSFYLQRSIIKIDKVGTKKTAAEVEVDDLTVSSIPSEFTPFKISIRRADTFGVRTNLNITKRPNTDLVSEAGIEVIDTRVDLITKIGTIIAKTAALGFDAAGGLQSDNLPKMIPVDVLINGAKVGREAKQDVDAADGVTVDFGAIPPDADTIDKLPKSFTTSGIVYAACRSATIKFKYQTDHSYSQTVKVADPNFFERIAFPTKGKVSFHNECGVSVTSEKDTGVTANAAIIDALVTQGKAIKDAIDAAKKADATKGGK